MMTIVSAPLSVLTKALYSTRLIHDYMKTGNLKVAHSLFEFVQFRNTDIKLYGSMLNSFIKNEEYDRAYELLHEMRHRGVMLNEAIILIVIKLCVHSNNADAARAIHSDIEKQESIYRNINIQNALIGLYTKLDDPSTALQMYRNLTNIELKANVVTYLSIIKLVEKMKDPELGMNIYSEIKRRNECFCDIKVQNALISMFSSFHSGFNSAMDIFNEIKSGNVGNCKADDITYLNIIKGCASHKRLVEGMSLHRDIERLKYSVKLQNALMDMYSECGEYRSAMKVFDGMKRKDAVTYCLILTVCGKSKDLENGRRIHEEIENVFLKHHSNRKCIWIYNSLIDMYGKWGDIQQCQRLWRYINESPKYRSAIDIVSFGAMMNAYTRNTRNMQCNTMALELFELAMDRGLKHNHKTVAIALMACRNLKDRERGLRIYHQFGGQYENNIYIQNAINALVCHTVSQSKEVVLARQTSRVPSVAKTLSQ